MPQQQRIISPEVKAVRRRVWQRRIGVVLAVVAVLLVYQQYMDTRYAHLREVSSALASGSQVYDDVWSFLETPLGQLTLQATVTEFGRVGAPGPINPTVMTLTRTGQTIFARYSGWGSVSESGAPIIIPDSAVVTGHTLDRNGRVAAIELLCSYRFCWDRKATEGSRLPLGSPVPDAPISETVGGMSRYSEGFDVVDRVKVALSNRHGRWMPFEVVRLSSTRLRPS